MLRLNFRNFINLMAVQTKNSRNLYSWSDPFRLTEQLTQDEIASSTIAENYSNKFLKSRILEAYRHEKFDQEIMVEMGQLGLLGPTIPEKYGGSGLNYVSYGLIAREIEKIDSGYRSAMSVQSSLVMEPIYQYGSEYLRQTYLKELASGRKIGSFGLTEAGSGSDPGSMKTTIYKDGSDYIINGSKTWITNAPIADVFIIWGRDQNNIIRGLVVDRSLKGLTTSKINGKLSLRASITGSIFLDNVRVSEEHMLQVKGLRGPFSCLNKARYGISWGVMGAAEFCINEARKYSMERIQFNKPLATTQLHQMKLADMSSEIALGLQGSLRVGRLLDKYPVEEVGPEIISIVKRNNCMKALNIARTARDMLGANGLTDEYHVMRVSNNLETVNTYEGTSDIHGLMLGRVITNYSAF